MGVLKMRRGLILTLFLALPCMAKTKVDVSPFTNKTSAGPCSAVEPWKKDIEQNLMYQLMNALKEAGGFNVVDPQLMRGEERAKLFDSGVQTVHTKATFKAAQYSVVGVLKTFDSCEKNGAEVALDIQVIENADGSVKQKFTSVGKAPYKDVGPDFKGAPFTTGLFRESPIGKATVGAINDATNRLKRAFPDREVASDDYKIRTIPRSRAR